MNNLLYIYLFIRTVLSNDLEEININNITTLPSLEYLGSGYNVLFNKRKVKKGTKSSGTESTIKDGDKENEIDTNYKDPVIKFNWSRDLKNLNNTLEYLHPEGTYIYKFPNCTLTQKNRVVNKSEGVEKMINSEVSVEPISLTGGFNSKKSKSEENFKNNMEKVIYCSIFIAGINPSQNMEYTEHFLNSLKKLKKIIKTGKKRGCTVKKYKSKVCLPVKEAWTDFFNSYGTHYVNKIVLGGKMVFTEEKNEVLAAKSEGSDLNLGLGSNKLDHLKDSEKKSADTGETNNVNMFGGVDFNSYPEWFRELKTDPVPIKLLLTSFKSIFLRYGIHEDYVKALKSF